MQDADKVLATKAVLARMAAALDRQQQLLEVVVSAHANGDLTEAREMTYALQTVQNADYERMKGLREALGAEIAAHLNVPHYQIVDVAA